MLAGRNLEKDESSPHTQKKVKPMFEQANFVIKQLQRTKKAMAQPELASFKPDGRSLADVAGLLTTLESTKGEEVVRAVALNVARVRWMRRGRRLI